MHRRTFLTASVLATTVAITHEKGALAGDARPVASEGSFGATGAELPLPVSEQLPLGPLKDTHYPDKHFESLDKRFKGGVNNGALERVATGFRWAEGPAYFRAGRYLIFSDIPNNRLMRLLDDDNHLSVFRSPSFNANGNTIDREGRLLSCEHAGRRIVRTEHNGIVTVLADRYDNKRFNSPNDIVVASNGSIWFTDPTYGISGNYEGLAAEPEQSKHNVFRVDAQSGRVSVVVDDFIQPNGICFSPDETKLYVIDSGAGASHIRVFDVDINRGTVGNGKVFADGFAPESPMACAPTSRATSGAAWDGLIRTRMAFGATVRRASCWVRFICLRPVPIWFSAARFTTVYICVRARRCMRATSTPLGQRTPDGRTPHAC